MDLVKPSKDKTSTLPNRDDSSSTPFDHDRELTKPQEDPTVIQRILDQKHASEDQLPANKKVTPLKISVMKRERMRSEDKIIFEASQPKKRKLEFSSSVECPHCDHQFPLGGQWKLRKHILQEHKDQFEKEAFRCEPCDKTFPSKSVFTSHHEMHTGKHPWRCNLCIRQFEELSALG